MSTATVYQGKLRCVSTCRDAAGTVVTDGPSAYGGEEQYLSPTDLLGIALGSCILTTIAITAERLELDLSGTTVSVAKELTAGPPLRIAGLAVTVSVPRTFEEGQRQRLERSASACPVGKSLHPDIDESITFIYG